VVEAAVARYLAPLLREPAVAPDTLVLGCTHFPVLRAAIAAAVGPGMAIVDSAATTATVVRERLAACGLLRQSAPEPASQFVFLATDGAERFARVGSTFLGRMIAADDVVLIDL
jgi:glutamate racemase